MSKITSASQLEDESGESPIVDFSKIYMDEVGGVKKACIYGLGSQAVFQENFVSSSASTTQPQDCSFDARVKEYVQEIKEEVKHEMRVDMREDIQHELREEMKHEMQLQMQEQVDKILQARLPTLIVGLPKPPLSTLPTGTPPTGTPPQLRHDPLSNNDTSHFNFSNYSKQILHCLFRIWIYFELFILYFALFFPYLD